MGVERLDPKIDSTSEVYHEHIARYLFAQKYVRGKRVLDVACGTGYGSHMLALAGAKETVGIDISKSTIKQASKNYQAENLNFYQGKAKKINWPSDYFDVAVSFETIEHINKRDLFLQEVKRVLRPGGIFIISTPNRIIASCYLIYRRPYNEFHKIEYTRKEFLQILTKYFQVVDFYGQKLVSSFLTPYLIRKPLEKLLSFLWPQLERKIYLQCNGPGVTKVKLFTRPIYFIVVALKK